MLKYTWYWLDGYESQLSWFLVSWSKSWKARIVQDLVELVFLSVCMIRHFQHDSTSFHFDAFPVLFLSLPYLTLFMIKKKSVCLDRQNSSFQKTFTLTYHHLHYITGVVVCHPYKLSFKYNVLNIPFAHTALLTPMNIYLYKSYFSILFIIFIHSQSPKGNRLLRTTTTRHVNMEKFLSKRDFQRCKSSFIIIT